MWWGWQCHFAKWQCPPPHPSSHDRTFVLDPMKEMHTFTFFYVDLETMLHMWKKWMHFEVSQPLRNHHEQVFNKMCIKPSPNLLMSPKSFLLIDHGWRNITNTRKKMGLVGYNNYSWRILGKCGANNKVKSLLVVWLPFTLPKQAPVLTTYWIEIIELATHLRYHMFKKVGKLLVSLMTF